MKNTQLRWKLNQKETGLRAVGAGPRGYMYHDGKKIYASVSPLGGSWREPLRGWYWVAGWGSGVPHKNTSNTPCETPEEAKKQAAEYVAKYLTKCGPKLQEAPK